MPRAADHDIGLISAMYHTLRRVHPHTLELVPLCWQQRPAGYMRDATACSRGHDLTSVRRQDALFTAASRRPVTCRLHDRREWLT